MSIYVARQCVQSYFLTMELFYIWHHILRNHLIASPIPADMRRNDYLLLRQNNAKTMTK